METTTFKITKKFIVCIVIASIVTIFGIISLFGFKTISEGELGVRYWFGEAKEFRIKPGLHYAFPIGGSIKPVDIKERLYVFRGDAFTSDSQTVSDLVVEVNYRLSEDRIKFFVSEIGIENIETRLVVPVITKQTKAAFGKIRAEELVKSRDDVQAAIRASISEELALNGLIVTNVSLSNISFSQTFKDAIEAKVIAEQKVLELENRSLQIAEENKQKIAVAQAEAEAAKIAAENEAAVKRIKAEADADAIKYIQDQLAKDPNYLKYYQLEKWDGVLPKVSSSDAGILIGIDGAVE